MNATSTIRNRALLSASGAALALAAFVALDAPPARAEESGTSLQLQAISSTYHGSESLGTYSKTLTFTISTTTPAPGGGPFVADSFSFGVEREMKVETGDGSGATGGNVEFEWKVEEGESAPPAIDEAAGDSSEPSANSLNFTKVEFKTDTIGSLERAVGGNVEFEWKVEEAQSASIPEVSGLKMEYDVIEGGAGIKIGVGELQECTISKSMDSASLKLTQYAINGNSPAGGGANVGFDIQVATSNMQNAENVN